MESMDVGKWVAQERAKLSLTQKQFGDKVGCEEKDICNLEEWKGDPARNKELLYKVLRSFGIGPSYEGTLSQFIEEKERALGMRL